ncbi:nucleotidyltransferase family protein [Microbacterium sp. MYb64]|uniref:nucleotidyltransferase family protein n=1 Tax=Microbacterium sp. MYb64 TaxID=1848691 RepID=UPI0015E2DBE7|nr:nucleotidyltransferase family protein [Microbacterium sp. MYb64]
MAAPITFDLAEATTLAHSLVEWVATEREIRVLAIKGPVASHYGLRAPRVSADADVLVEPSRFDDLCVLLEGRGWHERVGRETPSLLTRHSRTFIHDAWPCDIDVHRLFPGFFADPGQAFEALWKGRSSLTVAHVAVSIPSRAGAAVISALHAQRNARSTRNVDELSSLRTVIVQEFDKAERDEFYGIATSGKAVWVLRDIIGELGLGAVFEDVPAEDQRRWDINRTHIEDGSTVGWWIQVHGAPWYRKPAIIFRAAWVPRRDIPRNSLSAIPSRAEAWSYQRARWRRGIRAMLSYRSAGRRY